MKTMSSSAGKTVTSKTSHFGKMRLTVISAVVFMALISTALFASGTSASSVGDFLFIAASSYFKVPGTAAAESAAIESQSVAMAGAKMSALYEDNALLTANTVFSVGAKVYAKASGLTATKGYKFEVTGTLYSSGCKTGATTANNSADPFPGSPTPGAYSYVLREYADGICSGVGTVPDSDNVLAFNLAQATIFKNAALTTPGTDFAAGETAYVVVNGLTPSATTWSATWIKPSGTTGCANTAGSDRPSADASGRLPNTAGSFMQYPPNLSLTGDLWNRDANYDTHPCPALGSSNGGQWSLKLARSTTQSVTLRVFNNTTPVPPAAVNDSYMMAPNTTLVVSAANGVIQNDIVQAGTTVMAIRQLTPSHGNLQPDLNMDGSFSYIPDPGYSGQDSFTYILNDNRGLGSNTASVTININNSFQFNACSNFKYSFGTAPDLTSVFFNESEVLRQFGASTDGKVVAWYNDEHALTLGVSQITVIKTTGPVTTNYPVSPLPAAGYGSVTNPDVGTKKTLFEDEAGTDTALWNTTYNYDLGGTHGSRPLWPALYLTDITGVNAADFDLYTKCDWQNKGGLQTPPAECKRVALPPKFVYGAWKGATRTVDYTSLTNGKPKITVVPLADPAANNWLGVPDAPQPGGFAAYTNEGYGAEIVWTADQLGLTAGNKYRVQFMVHDGDQNNSGGDSGEGCMEMVAPVSLTPNLHLEKAADRTNFTAAGQTINYTYTISNPGAVTMVGPFTVTDNKFPGVTFACTNANSASFTLPQGASFGCITSPAAAYTTTTGDVTTASVTNIATAHGFYKPDVNTTTPVDSNQAQVTVPFRGANPMPSLSIVKLTNGTNNNSAPGLSVPAGSAITWTYNVANTGDVALTSIAVTDNRVAAALISCTGAPGGSNIIASLAVNASATCTATGTAVTGQYGNIGTASTVFQTLPVSATDPDNYFGQAPALSIVKTADEASYDHVGQIIHYHITATNTGNTTLASVTVTDPNVSDLSCVPANGSSLAPTASLVCTASHTVTQADMDNGSFYNQACVDDGPAGAAPKCADVTTPGGGDPVLSIVKTADEASYNAVGQIIHYHITATNISNVTIHNVTVTDPNGAGLTCVPPNGSTLAPGSSLVCTASHTVTQADIDAGHYYNQACVDDGAGGAPRVCDDEDTPSVKNPHLSIVKTAVEASYNAVGQIIHYNITATNDGNTTLAAVTVTDANAAGLSCTPANGSSLAPAAQMVCTATHTVTQADIDAGSYYNQACVDDGPGGAAAQCSDVTTPGVKNPHLSIVKTAVEASYNAVGQVIHYNITATNDGNTTLAAVTVTDPNVSDLACVPANGSSLAPTASLVCTASHTVTQADIDNGSFYNQACVDDGPGGAAAQCSDVTTPGVKNPNLSIVKTADEAGYNTVGQVIHYHITATNTGNTTLASVTVTDPNVSNLACVPANGSTLAPTASLVCTASHTVTQADIDNIAGVFNEACVDDGPAGAAPKCSNVTTPPNQTPNLSIVKTADEAGYNTVGQVIHYHITATNTGNTTLASVTVTDPNVSDLSCVPANGSSLAPTASLVCTASHTVTQADIDNIAGVFNEACVDDGPAGAAPKCSNVTTPPNQNPTLSLTKTARIKVITYSFKITNTGNVTLSTVALSDPMIGTITGCDAQTLAPGAMTTCEADYTVSAKDLINGFVTNVASATAAGGVMKTATVTMTPLTVVSVP